MRRAVLSTLMALCLAACARVPPPAGPTPAGRERIYGFPPSPENCDNPHTCGFACGPCGQCPEEGPDIPRRQRAYGLVDFEVRSADTQEPLPYAHASIVLKRRAPGPEGVRPRPPGIPAPPDPDRREISMDATGRARATLRAGTWAGTVGRGQAYPGTEVSFEVPECLTRLVLLARPLSRDDVDPKLILAGVSCDRRSLTCRQAGIDCPPGFAAEIRGGCFGECVPLDACLCREHAACPAGSCDPRGRCKP